MKNNSIITPDKVELTETISREGFVHPGIGCTAYTLSVMREQVIAGVSPWVDYFEGLRRTSYSRFDITPRYANQILDDGGIRAFETDAQTAWTQAILYIVTGNEEYRKVPLEIIKWYGARTQENFFPRAFPDSHIKIGKYVYTMCAAAEIMRYTAPLSKELAVTAEMINNLYEYAIKPIRKGTLEHNGYFMNQHTYAIIGYMAAAIMADDVDGYSEVVEWTTVNAAAKNQGRNGSIKAQIREMVKNEKTGEAVEPPILQLVEMGRDQPHAGGNIDNLLMMTKTMEFQKTKVDPVSGVVTHRQDGVSPVRFLDDRLVKGAALFIKYGLGYALPWIPAYAESGGEIEIIYGGISDAQRGRLITNGIPASYYTFKNMGYNIVHPQYRYIKTAFESFRYFHEERALSGVFIENIHNYAFDFWTGLTETASDEKPDEEKARRALALEIEDYKKDKSRLKFTDCFLDMSAAAHEGDIYPGMPSDVPLEVKTDGDANYVRMILKNAPRTMAVYSGGHSNSEAGFLVRSNGAVKLDLRRDSNYKKYQPFQTAYISDTNNEWRYVNFNLTVDCMLFIEATPMENPVIIDFEMINFNSDEVSALKFKISEQDKQIITYAGRNTEKIYSAVCAGSDEKVRYTAANLPDGAAISSDSGKLTWNPDARSIGNHTLYITADNGKSIDVLCLNIYVAPDLQSALKYAGRKYNPDETYVSKTLDNYKEALKREDIDTIQKAADALELLNPCLPDGSLNYAAAAKSDDLKGSLKLFTDWDTKTFVSIFSDEEKFFTIDFGDSFRLKADSYAIQCRDGFPLRVKDTCILGSNDGIGWVTLTEKPAETSAEMQMIYVKAEEKNNAYRYIRVSKASDRILDIGEFRIYGDRIENKK